MALKMHEIDQWTNAFPDSTEEMKAFIHKNGTYRILLQDEFLVQPNHLVHCHFIIQGLAIYAHDNLASLLSSGHIVGLQELFSRIGNVYADPHATMNCEVRILSKHLHAISLSADQVIKSLKESPELRSAWMQVLNAGYEKMVVRGLDYFHQDSYERLRQTLAVLRDDADDMGMSIPIREIQSITGISRSSLYRCLKKLQEKHEFKLGNGMISLV